MKTLLCQYCIEQGKSIGATFSSSFEDLLFEHMRLEHSFSIPPLREELREMQQEQQESPKDQIDRLAHFITAFVPGKPSRGEGAVDEAISIIQEYMDKNTDLMRELQEWKERGKEKFMKETRAQLDELASQTQVTTLPPPPRPSDLDIRISVFTTISEWTNPSDDNFVYTCDKIYDWIIGRDRQTMNPS